MNKSILEKFSPKRPIVLIGMMGAGKTSVGRALANLMSVPFFDSDAEIESAAGCSVAQIFSDYGEAEFRRMEREVTARLLERDSCLLSLGGGAFMDEQTRARIKQKAFSVWLRVEPEILLKRVLRHGNRPLLKGAPKQKLEQLLSEREPIYAGADLVAFCDDRPVGENARQIMLAIQVALGSQTR
jgi:shikimate kinase